MGVTSNPSTSTTMMTATSNTNQTNQRDTPTNAPQSRNNAGTSNQASGPNPRNQSKGNRAGSETGLQNPTNPNNNIKISKANNEIGGQNVSTSNSTLSYQRTASFGNQPSNTGTLTITKNVGSNKAIDYNRNSSHKKLCELSHDDFIPIRALVGFSTGFTIKAKITKKSELRQYQKNGNVSQVFSIDLIDEDGGEIQGTFFGDAATENFANLQENHVYAFSGGTIKLANAKFQA